MDDPGLVRNTQQSSWHNQRSPVSSGSTPGGPGAVRERAAQTAALFFCPLYCSTTRLASKQEEERCVSQARSSGSTTQKVTGSSSATEAVPSSPTTRPSRATASGRSRKVRQWNSRSLTAPKARRPETSRRSSPSTWLVAAAAASHKPFSRQPPKSPSPPNPRQLTASPEPPAPTASLLHTFERARGQVDLAVFDGYAKRNLRTAGLAQLFHLVLHQLGELVERHGLLPGLASRFRQRFVELRQFFDLAHRIAERRDVENAILRPLRLRRRRRALLREGSRPPFFAGAHPAIPQVDERLIARLQRAEAKTIASVRDVGAIVLRHHRFNARAGFPGRLGQPSGEKHVVFGFELFQLDLEALEILVDGRRHGRYRGMRNQTSGSHSSRAYGTGRSSTRTSVASEAPTISNSSRKRAASVVQKRAR